MLQNWLSGSVQHATLLQHNHTRKLLEKYLDCFTPIDAKNQHPLFGSNAGDKKIDKNVILMKDHHSLYKNVKIRKLYEIAIYITSICTDDMLQVTHHCKTKTNNHC